ncbi:MAG: ABC transporter permease [Bacteroidales bacterium]|nr:ABC transporter permease [Bacteroidales bacterium]
MLKGNLKLTLKLLKRKKIFSFITIVGMTIPLMFLMIIITSVLHFTSHKTPESNFDRVILFNELKFTIERPNSLSGNMIGTPPYDFIKKYIKTMKIPEKIGVTSAFEYYNYYIGNNKVRFNTLYTDDVFWDIADFKFIEGRGINTNELENAQLVAVIDEHTRNLVFGDQNAIGEKFKIFNKYYTIIGIVKNVDVSRQYTHANIWLPISTSESYMVNDIFADGCTCLILAKEKEQMKLIEEEFENIINTFDLSSYEGLTKIDGKLSEINFNTELKNILSDLFSIDVDKKYIIYLAYVVIFFFFIVLPAINLLYIHSSRILERSSEIGVRKSFGGAKQKLAGQFVIENITISLFSGLLGLLLTLFVFRIINYSQIIPGLHLSINFTGLLLCFLIWLLFGISTGLIPSLRMSWVNAIDALQNLDLQHKFKIFNQKMKRLKIVLIIEFLLTFFALTVILTFVFRFNENHSRPIGFNYDYVYMLSIIQYDKESPWSFGGKVENDEARELIKSSSFVSYYGESQWNEPYHDGFTIITDGIKYSEMHIKDDIYLTVTDVNMDDILEFNVIEGRWFDGSDERPDYYPIVLNKELKKELFGDKNPIGEYTEVRGTKCQVIGVIDDYKYKGEFSTPVKMIFSKGFLPNLSIRSYGKETTDFFRVKPGTSPEEVNNLARVVSQKYPDYEINITSLDSVRTKYIQKTLGPIVAIGILFGFIFLIVLLGLFGVLWYDISLRKQEIGIRRAIGASSKVIFRLIVKEMLVWASIGILLGIIVFVQISIFKVFSFASENTIISILCASLIIFIMVVVCSLLPASQAAKIQPAIALYEE